MPQLCHECSSRSILCVYEQWRLWPVCAHVRTLAKVFTARTHKECVNICAHLHAQMCTHSLCVRAVKTLASVRMRAYHAASIKKAHAASIKKTHASMHTCAHWSESSLLTHTKNVCTCVHASVRMCVHTFFVCRSSEDSGQYVHMCANWPESSLLIHTKNVCTCLHTCMHKCAHILCVYEQWTLWPVCARVHTAQHP